MADVRPQRDASTAASSGLTEHPVYGWPMRPCKECQKVSVMAVIRNDGLCFSCAHGMDEFDA